MTGKHLYKDVLTGYALKLEAVWEAKVIRADGSIECYKKTNQISYNGMNGLASRAISDATSPFTFLSVGTLVSAASIDCEITSYGEVERKPGAVSAASNELFFVNASWGGAADSLTSVSLASAAIVNHANSGEGVPFNIVNGLGPVVLSDSDFLQLEARVRVGSHGV